MTLSWERPNDLGSGGVQECFSPGFPQSGHQLPFLGSPSTFLTSALSPLQLSVGKLMDTQSHCAHPCPLALTHEVPASSPWSPSSSLPFPEALTDPCRLCWL